MPLLSVILVLIVVGVLLWLVNTFIPMAGAVKSLLNIVVVILLIVWLLKVFGLLNPIRDALKDVHINSNTHTIVAPDNQHQHTTTPANNTTPATPASPVNPAPSSSS